MFDYASFCCCVFGDFRVRHCGQLSLGIAPILMLLQNSPTELRGRVEEVRLGEALVLQPTFMGISAKMESSPRFR